MIQFARAKFNLDRRQPDGSTLRDHAQSIYRQTKRWPEDIPQEPVFPDALLYLWEWFVAISNGRGSSGFGANAITWSDLAAWSQLMRIELDRWEVTMLRRLDIVFLSSLAEKEES